MNETTTDPIIEETNEKQGFFKSFKNAVKARLDDAHERFFAHKEDQATDGVESKEDQEA